jgi:transcriptional regulator with XRE-family HTH domain
MLGGDVLTTNEWSKKFFDAVRQRMCNIGISQRELARLSGIPENTLGRYLNGKRIPQVDKIVNIANALNCTTSELIQFGEMVV